MTGRTVKRLHAADIRGGLAVTSDAFFGRWFNGV